MENNDNIEESQNEEQQPRSIESTENVYLRFMNVTNTTIEILWINYTGQYVRYKLLPRGTFVDVDTFKTHPWMAFDVITKDRMQLDRQFVYMPSTTREHLANNPNPNLIYPSVPLERRKCVNITLPVHSLRYRTLLALRNLFKIPDEVNSLELPQHLSDDLKRVIRVRNHRLHMPVNTIS